MERNICKYIPNQTSIRMEFSVMKDRLKIPYFSAMASVVRSNK